MLSRTILAPGIVLYKTDPKIAEAVLEKLKTAMVDNWAQAQVVNTATYKDEINLYRKCYDCALGRQILKTEDEEKKELFRRTDSWISESFNNFISEYNIEPLTEDDYVYIRYEESDKFGHHIDDGKKFPRTVSISAYLNDDYEGGELEFNNFGIKIKPQVGDIVIFCSAFPYVHEVHPVISGTRYAVVNWHRYATYPKMME